MANASAAAWECSVCGFVYDEAGEGKPWTELGDDWECPVCGAAKSQFTPVVQANAEEPEPPAQDKTSSPGDGQRRPRIVDQIEPRLTDIQQMAATGESIIEPMRTHGSCPAWDDILIKGAQLARLPLNKDEPVNTRTVIGPKATTPLEIDTPVYVTHMSFGAISREAHIALARGSAIMKTAVCSGEGGILEDALAEAHRYIFEYVPNRYSVTRENLRRVDAVEIKVGQSAKPGMGGHLPGGKVTPEIAAVRGFPVGMDIHSPARFSDIGGREDLRAKVTWLREISGGKPIGVKLAAGHIEADLEIALWAKPDFITIDGRPGATAAAPKLIKAATSIPTIFALHRARKYLDEHEAGNVSLIITGGLRVSSDFAKALAMGADAVAVGTAALIACGCQQYRVCHTGRCPVGIATQDAALRARLDVDAAATRLANFLRVCTEELRDFARLTGNNDVHGLALDDLCTVSPAIAGFSRISPA